MRRVAIVLVSLAMTCGTLTACSTTPGSTPQACAIFDRSYARWQVVDHSGRPEADPAPLLARLAAADTIFLSHLDQATAEAGGTALASALQATAAAIRRLSADLAHVKQHHSINRNEIAASSRALTLSVAAVRATCPRV